MDMKDYIIELSKKYSIVTQLTSFIAVEKRDKVTECLSHVLIIYEKKVFKQRLSTISPIFTK